MGAKKNKEGRPDLGQGFFYTTKQEDGDGNVRFVATPSLVREHFLTPKPPIWSFGSPQKKVINVACGSYHLLAVAREPDDAKLRVYSSGINNYGQLGQGDFGVETERHELTMVRKKCFVWLCA
jgi:alpha-tubulin suppressor-like RCC1 family protein